MNNIDYSRKCLKYKQKYLNLKQRGGDMSETEKEKNHKIIDIIELYDKTMNLYSVYRIRYDNTKNLINFIDLSNLIFNYKRNLNIKEIYKNLYINNLLELEKISDKNKEQLIFTLRQDTTKIIKELAYPNNEALSIIRNYIQFFNNNNLSKLPVYSEIYEKCINIKGLVELGTVPFNLESKIEEAVQNNLDILDIIRINTNGILNIIGNDYDNTINNINGNKQNDLNDNDNNKIDKLFKDCFDNIKKLLTDT